MRIHTESDSIPNSQFAIRNSSSSAIAGGLMLAVVFTTLALGTVEAWSVAIFELIVCGLLLLWGIKSLIDRRLTVIVPQTALPVAALLVLGLLQSVSIKASDGNVSSLSMDVEATRIAVIEIFFLLVCLIIAANFFDTRERLRTLANFLCIFGLALAVFALIQNFTWDGRVYWFRPTQWTTVFGPFINRNHYAGYMEMLVPVPVALIAARAVRKDAWLLYGFTAAVMALTVVLSLSRGGMISMFSGLIFVAMMSSRLRDHTTRHRSAASRILLRFGALAAIAVAITAGVIWIGADRVINRASESVAEFGGPNSGLGASRGWIWRDTWKMFRAHPVLGVGLGAYETVYPMYSNSNGTARVAYAHNDYLQVLTDGGIAGGVIALWFIIVVGRAVARGTRGADPLVAALALASGAGIFSILVHSLFDFNLQIPSNALLFLVLSAIVSMASAEEARTATLGFRDRREFKSDSPIRNPEFAIRNPQFPSRSL